MSGGGCPGGAACTCGCCDGITDRTPRAVENRAGLDTLAYRNGTWADFRASLHAALTDADRPGLARLTTRDDDDPTGARGRLAQLDFTRTGGLVDPPAFSFLTTGLASNLPIFVPDAASFFPDESVYDRFLNGPFAIRFSRIRLSAMGSATTTGRAGARSVANSTWS